MDELVKLVEEWAVNKELDKAESSKQFLKVSEEVGEVAAALARSDKEMLKDGIGDVVVTLIILALQNGMDIQDCLNTAYDEIKGRTGKTVNGVFVKSEDLEPDQVCKKPYPKNDYEEARARGLDLDNFDDYLSFYDLPFRERDGDVNMSKAYEVGTIRKFKVPYSMESEGRVFYENEIYEARYKEGWQGAQEEGALTVSFFAENGYFNFTDELFERVVKGWDLLEVEV